MTEHPLTPASPGHVPSDAHRYPAPAPHGDPGWLAHEADEGSTDWRRYASALLRFKWIVALAAVLGGAAAWVSWNRVTQLPEYMAYGSLWLQPGGSQQGPIVTEGILQAASWVDLLRSYSVLDTVVQQERLYLVPGEPEDLRLFEGFELGNQPSGGSYRLRVAETGRQVVLYRDRVEVARAALGSVIGEGLGFLWPLPADLEPEREVAFTVMTPREAANQLRGQLVTQLDQGSFIRLSLRGRDPARLAGTINRLMDRHVELAADLKRGHLDEQTEILEQQLALAEAELREAEGTLEGFRVRTITLPSDDAPIQPGLEMTRGPVFADFFQMRVEQEQMRRDRQRIQQVLAELSDSDFRVEAIELIPAVNSSSQLREGLAALVQDRIEHRSLLQRYTPEHPQVREVTDRIRTLETATIPSLLAQLARQLEADEEATARRIEASGADLSQIPPRAIEEARLRRRVTIAENLYTTLRQRYETSNLARVSSLPDVRVLDRATVSRLPAPEGRAGGVAFILFAGFLGVGIAGALVADRLDPRMRTPDEVTRVMGLTVLGVVPRIRPGQGKDGKDNMDHAREAFRALRTNLEFAYGSAGPIVVAVTSPGMEEGKTLVTSNLGVCFAELGRRTVIVDGDTRRGDLHRALEGERKPGLTDCLRGVASGEDVVQNATHPLLDFVGSGTQVVNSPELLSSARMGELLAELRKRYDVILVDCPPLGVGADALVLGCAAGHMLLLFRSGSTHREFAQSKLEPLARLPVRLLGAVLNDFEPDRLAGPHHYRYYGNYLPGYEAGAEEEAVLEEEPA